MPLDMSYFKEIAGSDNQLFVDLVNLMRSELAENREELLTYLNDKDFANSSRLVHTLKNKFAIFRNSKMADHCTLVKQSLDANIIEQPDIDRIINEIDDILKSL